MKIRAGFVANSSSSDYMIVPSSLKDDYDWVDDEKEEKRQLRAIELAKKFLGDQREFDFVGLEEALSED